METHCKTSLHLSIKVVKMNIQPISYRETELSFGKDGKLKVLIIEDNEFLEFQTLKEDGSEKDATFVSSSGIFIPKKYGCPKCGHPITMRSGVRRNDWSTKLMFRCKKCKYHFTDQGDRLKYPKSIREWITGQTGSTRKISKGIKEKFGIYISHATVAAILNQHNPLRNKIINQHK